MTTRPFDECPKCGTSMLYSAKWDAYYCRECNKWGSEPCGATADKHEGCGYKCWERPALPSEAVRWNRE